MPPCLRALMSRTALPRLECQMLWQHVLDVPRAWLIAHDTEPLPSAARERYRALEQRRLAGEPMAYIIGHREFMGHCFHLTPDVLIPRPETELLVETAIAEIVRRANGADTPGLRLLDMGTGSGAIAVAIALACPAVQVVATDISPAAIDVARCNASRLGANLQFYCGSWYDALPPGMDFDIIVANPPYIAAGDDHLGQGDLRYEPVQALTDGADGLGALRAIVSGGRSRLRPGGALYVEHGWDQADAVCQLLRQHAYEQLASLPDLAGVPRVSGAYSPTSIVGKA